MNKSIESILIHDLRYANIVLSQKDIIRRDFKRWNIIKTNEVRRNTLQDDVLQEFEEEMHR